MRAELLKLAGLPSVWCACALGLVLPLFLGAVSARPEGVHIDVGFLELGFGVIGALVLGVVAAGSEYRHRQIATSLVCVPSRARLLLVKTGALTLVVAVLATVSGAATLGLTGTLTVATLPRYAGVVVYWVLSALLAYGITLLTRSGVLPLTILILNSSAVSVSFLLSKVTPAAAYLPDLAGGHLFLTRIETPVDFGPLAGGLIMAAWVVALLGVAGFVFHRRDA